MQKQDTAAELAKRFGAFLDQLDIVVKALPVYLKHDPSKVATRHDFLGFVPRLSHRMKNGEAGRVSEENQYNGLCKLLRAFQSNGKALKALFYKNEDQLTDKISVMRDLSHNDKAITIIIDYFGASAALGLIQKDIQDLMASLVDAKRIDPSDEFMKAFSTLMMMATARSSKLSLMLNAVDGEVQGQLSAEEQAQFDHICERFDAVAKLSDLVVGFTAFTRKPVKKSAEALAAERRAEQLAIEAGALPEESREVRALRDFYTTFDLKFLAHFVSYIKGWENGEQDGASVLFSTIRTFISIRDREFFIDHLPNYVHAEVTTEEFNVLARAIHAWKKDEIKESELLELIAPLRQRNADLRDAARLVNDKGAESPRKPKIDSSLENLRGLGLLEEELIIIDPSLEKLRGLGILEEAPISKRRPLPPNPPKRPENDGDQPPVNAPK